MTLLSALRATKVLGLAVVLVAGGMMAAEARDGWRGRDHDHHGRSRMLPTLEREGHGGGLHTRFDDGQDTFVFRRGERSFYGGAITAYRSYGDSIYFYVDDDGALNWRSKPKKRDRSEPKVITVTPGSNDCSWEAGVCVIQPSW